MRIQAWRWPGLVWSITQGSWPSARMQARTRERRNQDRAEYSRRCHARQRAQIDVIALTVACAQKAHHRSTHQLTRIPKPFSRTRLSRGAMNQAEEVEIIRHGRELAANSVRGEEESAIKHGLENAIEAPRRYKDFSANGNNPLSSVSQSRGAVQTAPSPATLPQKPTQSAARLQRSPAADHPWRQGWQNMKTPAFSYAW
jgi:hypothetical protein